MSFSAGSQSGNFANNQSGDMSGANAGLNLSRSSGAQSELSSGTQTGAQAGTSQANTTDLWKQLSGVAGGLLNGNGLTGAQQGALNTVSSVAQYQPMGWALNGLNTGGLQKIVDTAAPQVTAPGQVSTSQVTAPTAAAMSAPYSQLYSQELIDPALKQYDYGTDRAMSALDARTAAGGGFGNTRSGLAYSDLGTQAAQGRAALEAQLKGQGLQGAIGAGQGDAASQLAASGQNASNTLNANEFTAGQNLTSGLANQSTGLQQQGLALSALGQQAQNFGNINAMGLANNMAAYQMGGGGVGNLTGLMGAQVPAFGQSTTGITTGSQTGVTAGTTAGQTSGVTLGANTGNYSSNSSGYSSGDSSQFGK